MVDARIHRHITTACRIVHTEPENTVPVIPAHLGNERPCRLLGSRRALIPVLERVRSVHRALEAQTAVTEFAVPRTGIGALGDIQRRTFVLVTHTLFDILHRHFALRHEPKRHVLALVLTFGVAESLARSIVKIPVHTGDEMVKERPYARLAYIEPAEIEGVEGGLVREIFVRTGEITFRSRGGNEVFVVHPIAAADTVQFLLQLFLLLGQFGFSLRDGGDACLVSVRRDGIVRDAYSHPVSAFLPFALTDQIHDPHFVRVTDGERLSFGGITVFVDQRDHTLNRLAGGLGTFEGDVDQRAIVNTHGVP